MARVAPSVDLHVREKYALIQLFQSRSEEARIVERAKIVLLCLDGMRNDEMARKPSVRPGRSVFLSSLPIRLVMFSPPGRSHLQTPGTLLGSACLSTRTFETKIIPISCSFIAKYYLTFPSRTTGAQGSP